jgi:hypothetical protein
MPEGDKPRRLQYKTYLQLVRNSVGSGMFRNWFLETPESGEFDAMQDGEDSCAFYVSGVLKIFDKIKSIHGTVDSTIKDLEESGWRKADEPKAGDVLVWETRQYNEKSQRHIGFCTEAGKAVSTSWTQKIVVEHDLDFGGQHRAVEHVYRMEDWDGNS